MNGSYGRDLDLNLLRVFAVVAEAGSVTAAAAQLYLTQPAVSAALKRLTIAIGAPLFARQGRGLALTARGERLLGEVRPHLEALVSAALSPARFDPRTSTRTFKLGLSDAAGAWLLPPLLRSLEDEAPGMRIVALTVQFRVVAEMLAARSVDVAVSVADELPTAVRRMPLFAGGFVCLFDPRHARLPRRPTRAQYLACDHVIVSYNGDLRGIIEDVHGVTRRVRCSLASFDHVGAVIDGTRLVATVPVRVADGIRAIRPHLRIADLPFPLPGTSMELLWHSALDDDEAAAFLRERIVALAASSAPAGRARPRAVPRRSRRAAVPQRTQ